MYARTHYYQVRYTLLEKAQKIKNMKPLAIAALGGMAINAGKALGIGAGAEDRRQLEQQRKLQELGIKGSKEMIDYQKMKDLEMWEATNWSEQVKQAEKAGLSTAWLMGKGGGTSGTIGSGGMSVGSGQAATAAQTEANKLQAAMQLAQVENLNADTEKKKAEASNIGADTEVKGATLEEIAANIDNKKAQTRVQNIIGNIEQLNEEIKNESMRDVLDTISYEAGSSLKRLEILANEKYISDNTKQEAVKLVRQELANMVIEKAAMEQNIKMSEAEIKNMVDKIEQEYQKMQIQSKDAQSGIANAREMNENFVKAMLTSAGISAGVDVTNAILKIFMNRATPIKGYR